MDYAGVVSLEIVYMVAFLVLTSAGLAIVFGMMRVINLAHGEFVMLGGYATIACDKAGINIYVGMLVVAPIVVGAVGLIVERTIIRFLYGRMIDTMLATWGLSLLLVGLITLIFGTQAVSVPAPISGYQLGDYQMGGYNLFIILMTVAMVAVVWGVLRLTRVGLIARGAMQGIKQRSGTLRAFRPASCDACNHTGYRGRQGIFELMLVDDGIRDLINQHVDAKTIKRKAVESGLVSLRSDGARKVLAGVTSIAEVLRATEEEGVVVEV